MNKRQIIALCLVFLIGVPFYLSVWTSDESASFRWFFTGLIMIIQFSVGAEI